jgi:2,3-bisphosphoglycerate-dependent phosphoglycerate mutase
VQIVVVRHGQSTNNVRYAAATAAGSRAVAAGDRRMTGDPRHYPGRVPDPALSTLGTRQAEALGRALARTLRDGRPSFAPTHLYASATTRAVQTARPLAEVTGLPVMVHPDTYEVGGIHTFDPQTRTRRASPGATLQELRKHCRVLEALPGVFTTPGQRWSGGLETEDHQALPRARRVLASLRAVHDPDDVVIVVSHQYFSQFVLAAAFGWTGPPWHRFRLDNTGHLSLRLDDQGAFIDWINRVDHLDPADVTN